MTIQTGINIMFLVILICHIIRLRFMQEHYKQMWHNIEILADHLIKAQEEVLKLQDTVKGLLELFEENE